MTSKTKHWTTLSTIFIALVVAVAIYNVWSNWTTKYIGQFGYCQPDNAGTFGDSYGALNTLFSGFAFIAIVASTIIQGLEFRTQLKELSDNNQELKDQTKIYAKQLNSLSEQCSILRKQHLEEQVHAHLAAQPFFTVITSFGIDNSTETELETLTFTIVNKASAATNVRIHIPQVFDNRIPYFSTNQVNSFTCLLERDYFLQSRTYNLSIDYTTMLGFQDTEVFNMYPLIYDDIPQPPFEEKYERPLLCSDMARIEGEIRQRISEGIPISSSKSSTRENQQ